MLQNSKFVNTKAYQKSTSKKNVIEIPVFQKASIDTSKSRQYESTASPAEKFRAYEPELEPINHEPIALAEVPALETLESLEELESLVKAPLPRHGSVNLDAMQEKENLAMQEEDWRSFFLGSGSSDPEEFKVTEPSPEFETPLLMVTSFAEESAAATPIIIAPVLEEQTIITVLDAPVEMTWAEAAEEAAKEIEALRLAEEREMAERCARALAEVESKAWKAVQAAAVVPPAPPAPAAAVPAKESNPMSSAAEAVLALVASFSAFGTGNEVQVEKVASTLTETSSDPVLEQSISAPSAGGAGCLDEIFNDMITDDQVFKRSCN